LNLLQGALTGGLEDWLQGVLAQVQYRTHTGYLEKRLVHDREGRNRVSKRIERALSELGVLTQGKEYSEHEQGVKHKRRTMGGGDRVNQEKNINT
jgi:hypothetical protein